MKQSRLMQELASVGFQFEPAQRPARTGKAHGKPAPTRKGRRLQSVKPLQTTTETALPDNPAAALLEPSPSAWVAEAQVYMVELEGLETPVPADILPTITGLSTDVKVGRPVAFAAKSARDLAALAQSEDQAYLNRDLRLVNGAPEGLRVLHDGDLVELKQPAGILTHRNPASTTNRILLLVHGGHSNSRHVLDGFKGPDGTLRFLPQWAEQYQTILFFSHRTLTLSPIENAALLGKELSAILPLLDHETNGKTGVDIICHSRGGLVVRSLLELPTEATQGIIERVRKVCFVATPNGGMNLFNPTKYSRAAGLFGLLATLLENMKGGVVETLVEWLAVQAKYLITLVANHLENEAESIIPGVACLAPDSPLIKQLATDGRKPDHVSYYAVGSNYEKWLGVVDELVDHWVGAHSDLVVETQSPTGYIEYFGGTHAGSPLPVERLLVFGSDKAAEPLRQRYPEKVDHVPDQLVHHSGYFRHERFGQWMAEHFITE